MIYCQFSFPHDILIPAKQKIRGGNKDEEDKKTEIEVDEDLKKPIRQLVIDFDANVNSLWKIHETHYGIVPEETLLTLNAQKYFVAMMAKVAMKHEEVSVRTLQLTQRITKLTYSLIGIGIISIILALIALFRN